MVAYVDKLPKDVLMFFQPASLYYGGKEMVIAIIPLTKEFYRKNRHAL
jgi:fructosamine-3-kinase